MLLVPSFGMTSPIKGALIFAKYLHKQNVEVVLVALDKHTNSKQNITDEIVHHNINFKCLNINGWLGHFLQRSILDKFVKENNIDVIVSYMLRPDLLVSNLNDIIMISSIRGMLRHQYSLLYGKLIATILLYFQIKSLQRMDHIWSMTKEMSNWLISEGVDSSLVTTVNNFVDVKAIRFAAEEEFDLQDKDINIGLFCNLIPRKRVDIAIKVISTLIHKYRCEGLKLHIAGDGQMKNYLKKLSQYLAINKNINFYGFLQNPLKLMRKMDLVFLTSEAEGMPRCLMEALSLGKTVIASDIPGVRNLISDKQTGYLIPVGDVEKMANITYNVIKNKLYIPPERLFNLMIDNYDINVCCEEMLKQIQFLYHKRITAK